MIMDGNQRRSGMMVTGMQQGGVLAEIHGVYEEDSLGHGGQSI
jgi:hypothetical protein